MTFFKKLLQQLRLLKWWEIVVLGLLLTRLIRWNGDEKVVPKYVELGYTYHSVWYFLHMRIIEALLFLSLYHRTKILPFLVLALWGLGKIFDELVEPFHYYRGEVIWQLLSLFITYKVDKWTQKQRQKQPV